MAGDKSPYLGIEFWQTIGRATWASRQRMDVQFSPDGNLIATASHDGTVRIWSGKTGEPIAMDELENNST